MAALIAETPLSVSGMHLMEEGGYVHSAATAHRSMAG
jgi:hypothetical protein